MACMRQLWPMSSLFILDVYAYETQYIQRRQVSTTKLCTVRHRPCWPCSSGESYCFRDIKLGGFNPSLQLWKDNIERKMSMTGPRISLVDGYDEQCWPNCQPNLVITLHGLSLTFWYLKNATAYHFILLFEMYLMSRCRIDRFIREPLQRSTLSTLILQITVFILSNIIFLSLHHLKLFPSYEKWKHVGYGQCDQMTWLFVNIWPFTTMQISPKA